MLKKIAIVAGLTLTCILTSFSQDSGSGRAADRTLRGGGRVNASTLGMEFELPLASYPGRGINVPISLSYSSKLWRMRYTGNSYIPGSSNSPCDPEYEPTFSENSASGWTTSLAVPYIEYVGISAHYDGTGKPFSIYQDVNCPELGGGGFQQYSYIRRIVVHLPSGETHELRPDDTPITAPSAGSSGTSPYNADNWNATYYAADGSNLQFIQNSSTSTYKLRMPDGSFYDFDSAAAHGQNRKATKFTDRNGNFTTYYGPGSVDSNGVTHPSGYWKDTLGRNLPIFGPPSAPTPTSSPQVYSLPGMTGSYKFQWKQLKGGSAAESGLTAFSQDLKYTGTTYACIVSGIPTYCSRGAGTYLFSGNSGSRVMGNTLFNPIVMTEIELPTGQKYKFSYDIYGRIEKITYPTGGEEIFQYGVVAPITALEPDDVGAQTNFGVVNRKVYKTAGQGTSYEWTYSNVCGGSGYCVAINSPDGTRSERYLLSGNPPGDNPTPFGFDNPLAGMAHEERSYDSSNPRKLVSKKLTQWTTGSVGQWHPRITQEESVIYDSTGAGISTTTIFEYEGNLGLRETPLLMKKSSQYAFVTVGSALPSNPIKVVETTYLINDPNYVGVKSHYVDQNMVGLATVSKIKNESDVVVAKTETVYDDAVSYPLVVPSATPSGWTPPANSYRGNPNTVKVWKDVAADQYIATHAQFDKFGNQIKAWDAKGNFTTTDFDTTRYAFPVQVTSPVPSDGVHGSNSAFVTTIAFDWITGLPTSATDANGLETRIEYDPVMLRPKNTKTFYQGNQVGSTAETIYNDQTNNYWVKNRAQIDTDKWAESITYFDGLGRAYKTEELNSQGNIFVKKEFDADGRVLRVSNPYRLSDATCYDSQTGEPTCWTTNVYDEASRIKEVVLQDGAKILTDYGVSTTAPIGVTKQITDQAGKKRKGITDASGNMVRVIEDPSGQNLNTDYVFDTLGNLRKTTQGVQNRYFYHDSLGRLLRAKQPEQNVNTALALTNPDPVTGHNQWSVKYEYDDNGNITGTTDAKGTQITATYDNLNRLKVRDYLDSTPDVEFYYDGKYRDITNILQTATGSVKGKTTGVKSSVSRTNYTSFDNLGRLETHQQITDGQTYGTSYVYNLSGGIVSETYPSGRTVNYDINADGDLSRVWGQVGQTSRLHANAFKYDAAGNVEQMRLGNGKWETAKFNNRLQIKEIGLGSSASDTGLLKLELSYGTSTQNNGNLREQKITVPTSTGGSGFTATQTYTYDDLNRLQQAKEMIGATETWKQSFTIDRYGNREFDGGNTTTLGTCPQAVCNPDINAQNDNRFSTGQGYSYDANGNVTHDAAGQRFGYDAENHQKEFFATGNSTTSPDATYSYDGDGRRVKKISSTETTIFVYNASWKLVAEYSTQIASTPQVSYLTTDHLGSPRVVTNQSGTVKDRKDYSAFGEESASAQRNGNSEYTAADQLRKNYTGYEKDGESGLEFAQARYYNPTHGRYTSIDPLTSSATIRNPQTFNRYSYVLNSPYKFTDPLGLLPVSIACAQWCPNSDSGLENFNGHEDISDNFLQQGQGSGSSKKTKPKQKKPKSGSGGKKSKSKQVAAKAKPSRPAEANANLPLAPELVQAIQSEVGVGLDVTIVPEVGPSVEARIVESEKIVETVTQAVDKVYQAAVEVGKLSQISENTGTLPSGADLEAGKANLLKLAADQTERLASKLPSIEFYTVERPTIVVVGKGNRTVLGQSRATQFATNIIRNAVTYGIRDGRALVPRIQ